MAWDTLARMASKLQPPAIIENIWHAHEMHAWVAHIDESQGLHPTPYIEVDEAIVSNDANNRAAKGLLDKIRAALAAPSTRADNQTQTKD